MWPFVSGSHQVACFQDSSMLCHVSVFHLFLSLNIIPLHGYTVDYWTSWVWTMWVHLQMNFKYSWPFVSVGVASMESTNCRKCTVFMIHSQLTQLVWYPQIQRTYGTSASMDFSIWGKSTNQFLRDTEGLKPREKLRFRMKEIHQEPKMQLWFFHITLLQIKCPSF